jgi:hypothetical protein
VAKVKNVSGEDRWLPALNREVKAGELFDVDDEELAVSLGEQPANWEVRADKKPAAAKSDGETV